MRYYVIPGVNPSFIGADKSTPRSAKNCRQSKLPYLDAIHAHNNQGIINHQSDIIPGVAPSFLGAFKSAPFSNRTRKHLTLPTRAASQAQ